ncbi:MAG: hypothetical protein JJT96_03145 [Opitutales bacterium]|nr:hypothetical protein [Opitutales bacterium]
MAFALEIAAGGLFLAGGDEGESGVSLPGRAARRGNAWVFGHAALRVGGGTLDDFWEALSVEPVSGWGEKTSLARSMIAYHHLRELLQQMPKADDFALVLPVDILENEEKLGLVLGMAKSLGIALRALVPGPLCAVLGATERSDASKPVTVVELEPGGWSLARLTTDAEAFWSITAHHYLPELGSRVIEDFAFRAWASRFLSDHAFDIHHAEDTERAFRESVALGLEALSKGLDAELIIRGRRERRLTISPATASDLFREMATAVARRITSQLSDWTGALILTDRARHLPGLKSALIAEGWETVYEVETGATAKTLARMAEAWPPTHDLLNVPEINRLPHPSQTPLPGKPAKPAGHPHSEAATHVLIGDQAHPLASLPDANKEPTPLPGDIVDTPLGRGKAIRVLET